jgi:TatD DNase family protein
MEKIQEQFFDIGANLTHPSFEEDIESVITDAQDLNVKRMSITGSDLDESIKAFELAKQYPDCLVSTAGIHPQKLRHYLNWKKLNA